MPFFLQAVINVGITKVGIYSIIIFNHLTQHISYHTVDKAVFMPATITYLYLTDFLLTDHIVPVDIGVDFVGGCRGHLRPQYASSQ